jgi:hypothetical protein
MEGIAAIQWIEVIVLGGLAGALGQGARAIVGLKKLGDEAAAEGRSSKELFEATRLFISLAIGFTAGALAAVLTVENLATGRVTMEQILAFAAAGYAGADFIEGAMSRFVPGAADAASAAVKTKAADEYLG